MREYLTESGVCPLVVTFDHTTRVRVIHHTAFDRAQIVMCFSLDTCGDDEGEEHVQSDLKLGVTHFPESPFICLEYVLCLLSYLITVTA